MDKYDYIVMGSKGLIGSSFVKKYTALGKTVLSIDSKNFKDYCKQNIQSKYFINANGNSYKFKANKNPEWDYEKSVKSLIDSIRHFKSDKYIFFSSIDVYPNKSNPNENNEEVDINSDHLEPYGLNKLRAENYLKENHNNFLIYRLGSVASTRSIKGALYDLTSKKTYLNPDSKLSFIDLKNIHLAFDKVNQSDLSNEVFNLTGVGNVLLKHLIDKFDISLSKLNSSLLHNKLIINISTDKILNICKLEESRAIAENYFIKLYQAGELKK